mgnify:FL=1
MLFPKLRPDVASGTSRRDNRRVTTQRQIRRDVISDTSCPDSSEPHLNYRKCFNNDMQYLVMCSENIGKRLRVYTIVVFSFIRTFAPSF